MSVKVRRLKRFKFCSNECKNKVKAQMMRGKQKKQKTIVKCDSAFCNRRIILCPWQLKREKKHFCSLACFKYYKTPQYKLDLEALQAKQDIYNRLNIWRL